MELVSTDGLRVGERHRVWQDAVCSMYPQTSVSVRSKPDFYGRIRWRKLGDIMLSDIQSCGQRVARESRHIRPGDRPLIQINFQVEGEGGLRQDGRDATTRPGDFVVYDSARPYEMDFGGPFRQLSIEFPSDVLRTRYGPLETCTARSIPGTEGPGRFLYGFAHDLIGQGDAMDAVVASRLQSHLADLLITAFCGIEGRATTPSVGRAMTLRRIRTFVAENLRDPSLTPATVARAQNLSLRYVHELFEAEGTTLGRWIGQLRLERARADLEDIALLGRSVADVAFSWGFRDAAHFSRSFRARFGVTPRECRSRARSRIALAGTGRDARGDKQSRTLGQVGPGSAG